MATKPGQTVGWTTSGAEETEPSSGTKADGYATGDPVPAEEHNWIFRLCTDWQEYLSDGVLTGDHELDVRRQDDDDPTPVLRAKDPDGRVRTFIDSMGYIGGSWISHTIPWLASGDGDIVTVNSGVIAAAYTSANANINAQHIEFSGSAATSSAGDVAVKHTNLDLIYDLDNTVFAMDFMLDVGVTGNGNYNFYVGMHDTQSVTGTDAATGTSYNYFMVGVDGTAANLELFVGDGSAESNVALVAASGSPQYIRLEYHGSSTPLGIENSNATVRVFVDGVLAVEHVGTNLPTGSVGMGFHASIRDASAVSSDALIARLGPVRMTWNPVLAGHTLSV